MPDQNYARIIDGKVWEIVPFDPDGRYPADWTWVACPADTQQGATYDAKAAAFTNPPTSTPVPPTPSAPTYRTTMTPVRFKAQFPLPVQIAIQIARNYSPVDPAQPDLVKQMEKAGLDILFGSLADLNQAGSQIDVADPAVQAGLDWMVATPSKFITSDLAAQIKRGIEVTAV